MLYFCLSVALYYHLIFTLHYRNNLFIYMHLLLEGAVYTEYSYEVYGYCKEMDTTLANLCVPYVLLVLHLFLFYLCCTRDPGEQDGTCLL